jgi:hypothetical protein
MGKTRRQKYKRSNNKRSNNKRSNNKRSNNKRSNNKNNKRSHNKRSRGGTLKKIYSKSFVPKLSPIAEINFWKTLEPEMQHLCITEPAATFDACQEYNKEWYHLNYNIDDASAAYSSPILIFRQNTGPHNLDDISSGVHNYILFYDFSNNEYSLMTSYYAEPEYASKHSMILQRSRRIEGLPCTFIISGEILKHDNEIVINDNSSQYWYKPENLKKMLKADAEKYKKITEATLIDAFAKIFNTGEDYNITFKAAKFPKADYDAQPLFETFRSNVCAKDPPEVNFDVYTTRDACEKKTNPPVRKMCDKPPNASASLSRKRKLGPPSFKLSKKTKIK